MKKCCEAASTERYKSWMSNNPYSEDRSDFRDFLNTIANSNAPGLRSFLFPDNFTFEVVDTFNFLNAKALRGSCSCCDREYSVVIVGSRLLLLIWRLLISASHRIRIDDSGDNGTRFRIELSENLPKGEAERYRMQAQATFKEYFGKEPAGGTALDELVEESEKCDQRSLAYGSGIVTAAELWILAHEVAHLRKDLPRLPSDLELDEPELKEGDEPIWREELSADMHASNTLFQALKLPGHAPDEQQFAVLAGAEFALRTLALTQAIKAGCRSKRWDPVIREDDRGPSPYRRFEGIQRLFVRRYGADAFERYGEVFKPMLIAWELQVEEAEDDC